MPPRLALLAGLLVVFAARPTLAQEHEIEIGPAGAAIYESPEAGAAVIRQAEPGMKARVLSRQSGYYKVRVGRHGQVGWIRVNDTVVPRRPAAGAPAPDAGAPRPVGAPGAEAKASPAKAPPPLKGPKRGHGGKHEKGFEVVKAESVADGGAAGAAEAGAEPPASRPAPPPAPPLVPPLRWDWPPPLGEWVTTTRTWAGTLGGVQLGASAVVVLLVALVLLYLVYRVVKFVVLLPVRALRAAGRRLGAAVRRRREAPKTERPEVQGRLDEVQGLAAAVQATGAAEISLHEVFVAAGGDDAAMSALATAAGREEASPDFPGWIALLSAEDPIPLGTFLRAYLVEVIWIRALSFLDLHPLFGGRGVRTERQEGDQESDIAFGFVSADGLGADLDADQQQTYLFLTTAVERARVHLPNPYALAQLGRELARAGTAAASPEDAATTPADEQEGAIPPLCVLLFGAAPYQHAGHFGSGPPVPREVGEALMLHMRAGKEIRYGAAHYAARSGVQSAVGVALVGALSGAMSPAAATLKLRQALAKQAGGAVTTACATLGAQVEEWLGRGNERQRAALVAAVARALGLDHLDQAVAQAEGLQGLHGRDLDADARRRLGKWERVTLPQALLHTHLAEVRATRDAVTAAAERYVAMLAALCERPDERVGLAAVGYLCAGLGSAAFADAPDAMRVQVATAARTLKRPGATDAGAAPAARR